MRREGQNRSRNATRCQETAGSEAEQPGTPVLSAVVPVVVTRPW